MKKTILLVEDSELNAIIAERHLRLLGYSVLLAESGEMAISLAIQQNPDLILMDLELPDMHGIQVGKIILASLPEIPIIAVTADQSPSRREACLKAGMRACLSKPLHESFNESTATYYLSPKETLTVDFPSSNILTAKETMEFLELDADEYAILVSVVSTHLSAYITLCKEYIYAERFTEVAQKAHTIKGECANIGALECKKAAEALEYAAKQNETASLPALLQTLQYAAEELHDKAQKHGFIISTE